MYEVILSNLGDVPATFALVQPTAAAFSFTPTRGTVAIKEQMTLLINFQSEQLGEINEDFYFAVEQAPVPLSLNIKGVVIGPTFHCTVAEFDFGQVPFGFGSTRVGALCNTSSVPMVFHVRLPEGVEAQGEFVIEPATGTIAPGLEVLIQLEFTPQRTEM